MLSAKNSGQGKEIGPFQALGQEIPPTPHSSSHPPCCNLTLSGSSRLLGPTHPQYPKSQETEIQREIETPG